MACHAVHPAGQSVQGSDAAGAFTAGCGATIWVIARDNKVERRWSAAARNPRVCEFENASHRRVERRNHAIHHRRRESLVPLPGFAAGRKIVQCFPRPLDRSIPEPWILVVEFEGILKQEFSSQSARFHIGQFARKVLEDAPEIVDASDDIFIAGVAQLEYPAGAAPTIVAVRLRSCRRWFRGCRDMRSSRCARRARAAH